MPLATNPNARIEIVLESDQDRPEKERPTFIYRYLTGTEQIRLGQALDAIEGETAADSIRQIYNAAQIGLVDWRYMTDRDGQSMPFEPQRLVDLVGFTEVLELVARMFAQRLNADDKKKFVSQLVSSTDRSANPAKE